MCSALTPTAYPTDWCRTAHLLRDLLTLTLIIRLPRITIIMTQTWTKDAANQFRQQYCSTQPTREWSNDQGQVTNQSMHGQVIRVKSSTRAWSNDQGQVVNQSMVKYQGQVTNQSMHGQMIRVKRPTRARWTKQVNHIGVNDLTEGAGLIWFHPTVSSVITIPAALSVLPLLLRRWCFSATTTTTTTENRPGSTRTCPSDQNQWWHSPGIRPRTCPSDQNQW